MRGLKTKLILPVIGLVTVDQATKVIARNTFQPPVQVFDGFQLVFTQNKGVAFSLPVPSEIASLIAFGVIIWVGWWLSQKKTLNQFERIGGILFVSGAIGNLIDRILFGAVTDFIAFWSFPVFNIADMAISIGLVIWLLEDLLKFKKKKS